MQARQFGCVLQPLCWRLSEHDDDDDDTILS